MGQCTSLRTSAGRTTRIREMEKRGLTMPRLRFGICLMCASVASVWGFDGRNPLLPRPQQVRYGPGKVLLRDLNIRFASTPSPEDRFAAQELSAFIAEVAGIPIRVLERPAAGPAVTLKRTGP